MSLSDLAAATGNLDFGGHKGVNVADPGADQDAATKKYHDDNEYSDALAVAAVLADDKYVQNTGDDVTGDLTSKNAKFICENIVNSASQYPQWYSRKARGATTPLLSGDTLGQFRFYGKNTLGLWKYGARMVFSVYGTIGNSYLNTKMRLYLYHTGGYNYIEMFSTPWHVDLRDLVLKNPKNHADATLSDTPKIVEIDLGGVPYYFKVYPTKT